MITTLLAVSIVTGTFASSAIGQDKPTSSIADAPVSIDDLLDAAEKTIVVSRLSDIQRRTAARLLAQDADRARDVADRLASSTSWEHRLAALRLRRELGDDIVGDDQVLRADRLDRDPSWRVREAFWQVAAGWEDVAPDRLIAALRDPLWRVRFAAVTFAALIPNALDPATEEALFACIADAKPIVAERAWRTVSIRCSTMSGDLGVSDDSTSTRADAVWEGLLSPRRTRRGMWFAATAVLKDDLRPPQSRSSSIWNERLAELPEEHGRLVRFIAGVVDDLGGGNVGVMLRRRHELGPNIPSEFLDVLGARFLDVTDGAAIIELEEAVVATASTDPEREILALALRLDHARSGSSVRRRAFRALVEGRDPLPSALWALALFPDLAAVPLLERLVTDSSATSNLHSRLLAFRARTLQARALDPVFVGRCLTRGGPEVAREAASYALKSDVDDAEARLRNVVLDVVGRDDHGGLRDRTVAAIIALIGKAAETTTGSVGGERASPKTSRGATSSNSTTIEWLERQTRSAESSRVRRAAADALLLVDRDRAQELLRTWWRATTPSSPSSESSISSSSTTNTTADLDDRRRWAARRLAKLGDRDVITRALTAARRASTSRDDNSAPDTATRFRLDIMRHDTTGASGRFACERLAAGEWTSRNLPRWIDVAKTVATRSVWVDALRRGFAKKPRLHGNVLDTVLERDRLVEVTDVVTAAVEQGRVDIPEAAMEAVVRVCLVASRPEQALAAANRLAVLSREAADPALLGPRWTARLRLTPASDRPRLVRQILDDIHDRARRLIEPVDRFRLGQELAVVMSVFLDREILDDGIATAVVDFIVAGVKRDLLRRLAPPRHRHDNDTIDVSTGSPTIGVPWIRLATPAPELDRALSRLPARDLAVVFGAPSVYDSCLDAVGVAPFSVRFLGFIGREMRRRAIADLLDHAAAPRRLALALRRTDASLSTGLFDLARRLHPALTAAPGERRDRLPARRPSHRRLTAEHFLARLASRDPNLAAADLAATVITIVHHAPADLAARLPFELLAAGHHDFARRAIRELEQTRALELSPRLALHAWHHLERLDRPVTGKDTDVVIVPDVSPTDADTLERLSPGAGTTFREFDDWIADAETADVRRLARIFVDRFFDER